jgi:hypothetical protein
MSREGFSAADERRSASRFRREPGWDTAIVRCPDGESLTGDVHDESLGGVSLILRDLCQLCVDQKVEIAFEGKTLPSIVRHIRPREDGGYIVGFSCHLEWNNGPKP